MFKKLSKFFVATTMCALLVAGTVSASTSTYSTGDLLFNDEGAAVIRDSGSRNYKYNVSQPWSLYVSSIQCVGDYGIRFYPGKLNGTTLSYCSQSGVWRHETGWVAVAFASGEAQVGNYGLGARRDDDEKNGTFKASGWWSADRATSQ